MPTDPSPMTSPAPHMRLVRDDDQVASQQTRGRDEIVPFLLAISCAALGYALHFNFGQYDPRAIQWLTVTLALSVVGILMGRRASGVNTKLMFLLPAIVVALGFVVLNSDPLTKLHPLGSFRTATAFGLAAMLVASIARDTRLKRLGIMAMVFAELFLAFWTLRVAPQPPVDVCIFGRESAEALLHGSNPYALTFEDPYAPEKGFYGDGISSGGRLLFGYPYPPLPLLLTLPAHANGDFRFAMAVAATLAIGFIACMRPGRIAPLAAGLLMFTPSGLFVLEAGWIEPLVVAIFAAVIFVAVRYQPTRRWAIGLGILIGLLFAAKQYLIFAAPALWLLPAMREKQTRKPFLVAAIASALVVTVPFFLWNPKAFLWSVALLQFHQPFRPDALSFMVPWTNVLMMRNTEVYTPPPSWPALVLAPVFAILCARRLHPTPASFAAAVALTLLIFFAMNKQAFCNYYYLVIGALACAIAASKSEKEDLNHENTKSRSGPWFARPTVSSGPSN